MPVVPTAPTSTAAARPAAVKTPSLRPTDHFIPETPMKLRRRACVPAVTVARRYTYVVPEIVHLRAGRWSRTAWDLGPGRRGSGNPEQPVRHRRPKRGRPAPSATDGAC